MRDPASLNKPSTLAARRGLRIGRHRRQRMGDTGPALGLLPARRAGPGCCSRRGLCAARGRRQRRGHAAVGLPTDRLILLACGAGGACAGWPARSRWRRCTRRERLADRRLRLHGILVSFVARHKPLAIVPVAFLFGGFAAARQPVAAPPGPAGCHGAGAAGIAFVLILASRGVPRAPGVPPGAAARCRRPESHGEAMPDERRRPVDPWLAGIAIWAARCAWACPSFRQPGRMPDREERADQPGPGGRAGVRRWRPSAARTCRRPAWLGVLAGALAGGALALLHGLLCSLPRVNDVATGIALMLLGTGLAFYRQAADPAAGAADPVDPAGPVE